MKNLDARGMGSFEILKVFRSLNKVQESVKLTLSQEDIERFGYKAFVDLAQLHFMKMLTPQKEEEGVFSLEFQKLKRENSFHLDHDSCEKYGVGSEFFAIDKNTQFSFLYHFQHALEFINIENRNNILNLGVNKADEFKVIEQMLSQEQFFDKSFVGIDHSASAIEYAKKQFAYENMKFFTHDINELDSLKLGRFDLIVSIGTLQSSNISFNKTFMELYQNYLSDGGAIILGFPNCRWIDGEMVYGAKAPNYNFSEMSLVLKDLHFCKKYLQQKKYRVIITGKDYLFLSARKIG